MKVFWTKHALTQLDSIYEFVAQDSPHYARQLADRLTGRTVQLGQFPYSGRMVPELAEPTVREVFESSYRLIYIVQKGEIRVLTILHSAMNFPEELELDSEPSE